MNQAGHNIIITEIHINVHPHTCTLHASIGKIEAPNPDTHTVAAIEAMLYSIRHLFLAHVPNSNPVTGNKSLILYRSSDMYM